MSIALIAANTKKRNGVYCCVIHETKYIVDILCTAITFLNNEINLYMKKCFFQTYATSIFHFFEKLFYYYDCKLWNIYKNTCAFIFLLWNQKQPPEVFYQKVVLKNFATFTGKHLCWNLFLIKLQAFRPDSKKDFNTGVFLWILRNFEEHLFWRTSANGCFRWRVHYYIISNEKS